MSTVPLFGILVVGGVLLGSLAFLGLLISKPATRKLGLLILGLLLLPAGVGTMLLLSYSAVERSSAPAAVVADVVVRNEPIGAPFAPLSPPLETSVDPSLGVLLLPAILLVAFGAAAWRWSRHGRSVASGVVAVASLLVLGVFGLRFLQLQRAAESRQAVAISATRDAEAEALFEQLTEPRIDLAPAPPAVEAEVTTESEGIDDLFGAAPAPVRGLDPPRGSKPSWVMQLPRQTGGHYYNHLVSQSFGLESDALAEQRRQLITEAMEYVRVNATPGAPRLVVSGGTGSLGEYEDPRRNNRFETTNYFGIRYTELRDRLVEDEHYEEIPNHTVSVGGVKYPKRVLHTLVHLSPQDGQWLLDAWRNRNARPAAANLPEGSEAALVLSCLVLAGLAGLYGLLRLDEATAGRYTKWLLIGVPLGIILFMVILLEELHIVRL